MQMNLMIMFTSLSGPLLINCYCFYMIIIVLLLLYLHQLLFLFSVIDLSATTLKGLVYVIG